MARITQKEERWVGASTQHGSRYHAVWVTYSENPEYVKVDDVWVRTKVREGLAICGVKCPDVIAGVNHGHDWEYLPSNSRCINCIIALRVKERV